MSQVPNEDGVQPERQGIERWAAPALVLIFVLALAGGGAALALQGGGGEVEVALPTATPPPVLKAYISGAVHSPGVYAFDDGDRLANLLERAGGPLGDADTATLNLALRLQDEGHYIVPTVGGGPAPSSGSAAGSGAAGGLINLNTASAEQLTALPGIGDVKAAAIVAHRENQGPFAAIDDVLQVPGIGPATLNGIADMVTVR